LKATTLAVEAEGHDAQAVEAGHVALAKLKEDRFDVVFLDLRLDREDGLEILTQILRFCPQLPVVVFTAYASIDTAVEAMRRGAFDYVPKPFTPEMIRQVLRKISKTRKLEDKVAELESLISHETPSIDLTSEEPAVEKMLGVVFTAAPTTATILILGESGTGKSVLAKAIHERSQRKEGPFLTVHCPSLSRELLESELFGHVKGAFTGAITDTWGKVAAAAGGTLFLDEIGELPMEIQPKLLRLLQEKDYERVGENKPRKADVRVIAATNRDLETSVREGAFREDLFYRLNVINVRMPALRDRKKDLMRIAEKYLRFFSGETSRKVDGFSTEAVEQMMNYVWPGNLRELCNAIERAVILCKGRQIEWEDLPEQISGAPAAPVDLGSNATLEELEAEHIRRVIAQSESLEAAAKTLGIHPVTLYRKRKKVRCDEVTQEK
jgi:NtrC-family two-component system response regulator AlgB